MFIIYTNGVWKHLYVCMCILYCDCFLLGWSSYRSVVFCFCFINFFSFEFISLGSLWWRIVVRDSERGANAFHPHCFGKSFSEFLKKSIAIMVSTDRQSVGYEIIWQPQGSGQRKNTSEDFRTLGYSPMQFIQVS